MEELKNLQQMYSLAAGRFNQYEGNDFVLPQLFKDVVKEINSNSITYNEYSAVIQTKGTQNAGVLNIYLPNQWFYIASYFTDFYNELQKYRNLALMFFSKERLKELNGKTLTEEEKDKILNLPISEKSKNYLIRFVTDYSWWFGAKTVDRADFYVSPILNSARLVNASQSFVADLCAFLADKPNLVNVIINSENNPQYIELLREKFAATFLRKALPIAIEQDTNLNRLAALDKCSHTSVQLKINEFPLGRDATQLPNRIDDVDTNVEWVFDNKKFVLYLEWTPEMMENQFFPVFNEAYRGLFRMDKDSNGEYVFYKDNINKASSNGLDVIPRQQIFYGAPGTGKSHRIKDNERVMRADEKNLLFRTTFHPDSDYSTFVGAYKPTMKTVADKYKAVAGKDEEIAYEFVPQAFLQAYIAAWNNQEEDVFLIIEEINRGNCSQIFGDLFQLLDRDNEGFSEYPIKADRDLVKYLIGKDDKGNDVLGNKDGIKDGKLKLPKNLYIWATMNTSDQSLFPIDSAFKRRWDWKYIPIDTKKEVWYINVDGALYSWTDFLEKINNDILTEETAEDKHLGFYFCKAVNNVIDVDTFVGKVLFYLWNDVFKVYGIPAIIGSSRDWAYTKFYSTDGSVDKQKVKDLMEKLTIPVIDEETGEN